MTKIEFILGDEVDGVSAMRFTVPAKKTLYNRFRYWMLFKFFPFEFKRWLEEE